MFNQLPAVITMKFHNSEFDSGFHSFPIFLIFLGDISAEPQTPLYPQTLYKASGFTSLNEILHHLKDYLPRCPLK